MSALKSLPLCVLSILGIALAPAGAAVLAQYEFTGGSLASSDPGTDWSTINIGGNNVPTGTDGGNGQPPPSLALTMGDINGGSGLAFAIAQEQYYFWNVAPDPATGITYEQFSFDINKLSGGADVGVWLLSNITGYNDGDELGSFNYEVPATPEGTWRTGTFDLTTSALPTGIDFAVEFRLYMATPGTFGPNQIKLDNLLLEGTAQEIQVALPEPSTTLFMALGLLLMRGMHGRSDYA